MLPIPLQQTTLAAFLTTLACATTLGMACREDSGVTPHKNGPLAKNPQHQSTSPKENNTTMKIMSAAFDDQERIPKQYTGEGKDASPPLRWTAIPENTQELALIMDDPDAPRNEPWVHWVLYKLPPTLSGLPEAIPTNAQLNHPHGALQGTNSWGNTGYGGPMPPPGHRVHHYHFKLYALSKPLDAQAGLSKKELLSAMKDHVLAKTELIGTYER